MADTATLICPKCRGEMRSYERNGVLVDQCEECRGIFLDRGELEQLLDAERGYERRDERRRTRSDEHYDRDDDEHHHDRDDDQHHGRRRRRSSLIADLFGGGE
jgi:Zn-finger nucleic acid-binding protein